MREPSDAVVGQLLADALRSRTNDVYGSADSLSRLRREMHPTTVQPSRLRALRPALSGLSVVLVVALLIAAVNLIRGGSDSGQTHKPQPTKLSSTGSGYRPDAFYPAVNTLGQAVIVRAANDTPVRLLPLAGQTVGRYTSLSPMVLSPDGNRVYGVWRETNLDGSPFDTGPGAVREGSEHVGYIDLASNKIDLIATRSGYISGMSLSADGSTIAYALRDDPDGIAGRTTIYLHDLPHDKDRHFFLPVGQQVIPMALSPDGSQLAIDVSTTTSPLPNSVRVISTTGHSLTPTEVALNGGTCATWSYSNVQWAKSGLYAIGECQDRDADNSPTPGDPGLSIVRLNPLYTDAAAIPVTHWESGYVAQLIVSDTAGGPVFYVDQTFRAKGVIRVLKADSNRSRLINDLRLSGPSTYS